MESGEVCERQTRFPTHKPSTKWRLPKGYFRDAVHMVRRQWYVSLGHVFEWYEFYAYGYVAKPINTNFFKENSNLTWTAFGLAMAIRPFGSLFFGWFGDNFGRRLTIITTLLGMTVCTTLHGCLPSYYCAGEVGGTVGLVLLLFLRLLQGFFCGGQVGAPTVHLAEMKEKHIIGAAVAVLMGGAAVGIVFANGLAAVLSTTLSEHQMNLWGWRVPFVVSFIPGIIALYFRASIDESDDFDHHVHQVTDKLKDGDNSTDDVTTAAVVAPAADAKEKDAISLHRPTGAINTSSEVCEETEVIPGRTSVVRLMWNLLKQHPVNCIACVLGVSSCATHQHIGGGSWQVSFVSTYGAASTSGALNAALVGHVFYIFAVCTIMTFVDAYGLGIVNAVSICVSVVVLAAAWVGVILLIDNATASYIFLVIVIILKGFAGGSTAILWTAELFPTEVRMTGFVFYNLCFSIIGGFGPVFVNMLAEKSLWGPGIFMVVTTAISGVVMVIVYTAHCRGRMNAAYIRPELY